MWRGELIGYLAAFVGIAGWTKQEWVMSGCFLAVGYVAAAWSELEERNWLW